jgi:hypothetical protein
MATKQTTDIYIKIGVIVGAYFLILKPILQKLGIQNTPAEDIIIQEQKEAKKQGQQAQISPLSAFSPTFYKTVKNAPLIKMAQAQQLAKVLNNSVSGSLLGDDIGAIYNVFRRLQFKTQVSWLAKIYGDMYKSELINDLKNGAKNAALIFNFRAGLNDNEMDVIYNIVKNLK